jgi:uncharacterized membrane protein
VDTTLYLIVATLAFLGLHIVPSTPLRRVLSRKLGESAYLGLFSVASLAGLFWMSLTYSRAPYEALWPGLRWVPAAVLPFSFILLACGLLQRNPALVGMAGALRRADAVRGILRVTRHPVMWAVMLWAAAHVLALGTLQAAIFFGGLFLLAAAGTTLQDARKARALGEDWRRFASKTSNLPFAAVAQGRTRLVWREIGWARPFVGLALYAVVLYFHPWLFGVRPY